MLDWRITSGTLIALIIIFALIWSQVRVDWEGEFRSVYASVADDTPLFEDFFDLYVDEGQNWLIYVREECIYNDISPGFFLHLVAADPNDLPPERQQTGFDNLDFGFEEAGLLFDNKCVIQIRLPGYSITGIRTGQYIRDGDQFTNLWEQEALVSLN